VIIGVADTHAALWYLGHARSDCGGHSGLFASARHQSGQLHTVLEHPDGVVISPGWRIRWFLCLPPADQSLTLDHAHGLVIINGRRMCARWPTDRHPGLTSAKLVISWATLNPEAFVP
jgi:hypothetical protein